MFLVVMDLFLVLDEFGCGFGSGRVIEIGGFGFLWTSYCYCSCVFDVLKYWPCVWLWFWFLAVCLVVVLVLGRVTY